MVIRASSVLRNHTWVYSVFRVRPALDEKADKQERKKALGVPFHWFIIVLCTGSGRIEYLNKA